MKPVRVRGSDQTRERDGDGTAPAGEPAAADAAATEDRAVLPALQRPGAAVWRRGISVLALLLLWLLASVVLSQSILPGPIAVGEAAWGNLQEGETYFHLFKTVLRVIGGMGIAVAVGLVFGLVMGLSKLGEQLLDTWVLVAFTIPSVVYGILAILWFGLNDGAAILAIGVTAMPTVALNMWQGVKAIDISLIHMGRSFRFSRTSILRKIVIPQVMPYILAALRYALGVAWKIATVVELIGLSSGVGYQLGYWFGLFNMTQVLAWTILFTIVLLVIEFAVLKPFEAWVTRWRPAVQR